MSSLLATKLFESAKVITLTGHFKATRGYQISEKLFQSLPKEYQKILTEEIIRGGEMMTKMSLDNRGKYIKKLKDVGVTFVTPDIAAYIVKIQPFYDGKGYEWTRNDYEQILKVLKSN